MATLRPPSAKDRHRWAQAESLRQVLEEVGFQEFTKCQQIVKAMTILTVDDVPDGVVDDDERIFLSGFCSRETEAGFLKTFCFSA